MMGLYKNESGNIVVLILIAVALFGALTFTLSKSMQGGNSDELDEVRAKQYASELITYVSDAESVIAQMNFNGSDISEIDPILPSDAAFETGSDIHKLFHVDGGGLNYKPAKEPPFVLVSPAPTTQSAWVVSNITDVEWTETTANDIILTAFGIEQSVCREINNIITGSISVPQLLAVGLEDAVFAEDGGGRDLTTAECADCETHPSLCVSNSAGNRWFFYSIIGGN